MSYTKNTKYGGKKSKTYTKRSIKKENKTKKGYIQNDKKSQIVRTFIEMLNTVKLYHWRTYSYSEHKATDELYDSLNKNIDRFVEVLLGKDQSRVKIMEKRIELLDFDSNIPFKNKMLEYRQYLMDMNIVFNEKRDSDLLSIRDDIVSDLDQTLYLFTFSK